IASTDSRSPDIEFPRGPDGLQLAGRAYDVQPCACNALPDRYSHSPVTDLRGVGDLVYAASHRRLRGAVLVHERAVRQPLLLPRPQGALRQQLSSDDHAMFSIADFLVRSRQ